MNHLESPLHAEEYQGLAQQLDRNDYLSSHISCYTHWPQLPSGSNVVLFNPQFRNTPGSLAYVVTAVASDSSGISARVGAKLALKCLVEGILDLNPEARVIADHVEAQRVYASSVHQVVESTQKRLREFAVEMNVSSDLCARGSVVLLANNIGLVARFGTGAACVLRGSQSFTFFKGAADDAACIDTGMLSKAEIASTLLSPGDLLFCDPFADSHERLNVKSLQAGVDLTELTVNLTAQSESFLGPGSLLLKVGPRSFFLRT